MAWLSWVKNLWNPEQDSAIRIQIPPRATTTISHITVLNDLPYDWDDQPADWEQEGWA